MRSADEFWEVKELVSRGLSDYEIAKLTHVPRGTIQRWRHRDCPPALPVPHIDVSRWQVMDPVAYCYLLGCYLGDGHVSLKPPHTWMLRISCDRKYTAIIDEVRSAMEITFPGRRSTKFPASTGASDVVSICHPA